MRPRGFPEADLLLTAPAGVSEDECGALPALNDGTTSLSCWSLSWRERLSALLFGTVWLQVWMGPTQPPVALTARRRVLR